MIKKILLLLLIPFLLGGELIAQTPLQFDTKFYDAIDRWVVIPKAAKDSVYTYGFIYLDVMAGPTFNLEGRFKIDGQQLQKTELPVLKTAGFKYRLAPNTHLIHVLSPVQLAELKADSVPGWLAIYKNVGDDHYQIALGSMYNANRRPDLSRPILEKIYKNDKNNEKLIFELSYAYNALKEYDKAITVLKAAIKESPQNALYHKELVYSYAKLMKLKNAEEVYQNFMQNVNNKQYQYEMAYNILYLNFETRDKPSFDKWASIVERSNNQQFLKNVQAMKEGWDKK